MTNAIQLENVRFRWQKKLPCVLDIPALSIARGERVFLHGPSGSGKSTLLGLLGGVLVPETGTVSLLGQPLSSLGSRARDRFRADHVGFLFQQFNLIPFLSARDNVLLPCRFSRIRQQRAQQHAQQQGDLHAVAERLLQQLDLAPALWAREAAALSVGQQQRVALARALIGQPDILIADEPTSALDAQRQTAFLELMLAACAAHNTTVLFVSHDHRLATQFSRALALGDINVATQDTATC